MLLGRRAWDFEDFRVPPLKLPCSALRDLGFREKPFLGFRVEGVTVVIKEYLGGFKGLGPSKGMPEVLEFS